MARSASRWKSRSARWRWISGRRLFRRTGTLQVSLHAIPKEISNLNLELSFIPSSVSFSGSTTNTFGTITKPVDHQGKVMIRTFPAKKGETTLSVTYDEDNTPKRKIIPFSVAIDTNQTIHVECNFPELTEGGIQGNGESLLRNGDELYSLCDLFGCILAICDTTCQDDLINLTRKNRCLCSDILRYLI